MNNKSILMRLEQLEQAHGNGRVTVHFADGTKTRLPLPDVIPMLLADENSIVEIVGDGGRESGRLLDLIRGVIVEPIVEEGDDLCAISPKG